MKLPFGVKIGLAITALAVGSTGLSLTFFYNNTRSMLFEQMGNRLEDIGTTARQLFTKDELQAIERLRARLLDRGEGKALVLPLITPGAYAAALPEEAAAALMAQSDFQLLVARLRTIKSNTRRWVMRPDENGEETRTLRDSLAYATLLITIPESGDRKILQFIADADYDKSGLENPIGNLFYNNSEAIRNAFGGEVGSDREFRHEDGEFLFSAGIPLLNGEKRAVAVLALDYDAQSEANYVHKLWHVCVLTVVASFALSILIAMALARVLNRPLRVLREGAEKVRQRDFSTRIELNSSDEMGLLASTFNNMVAEIRDYATGLESLNAAYYRFVPRAFLDQLGIKSIVDVRLGDQVQRQMNILFTDIRSFTTISESMSPRENFDFINEYLGAMSPIIRAHGGFIDKYIGDAIMALFPDGIDQALKAAVAMQRGLGEFNEKMIAVGRLSIKTGIGVHRGHLMLGTVGEEMRMEGTVISDAVNLASRLEGLTKEYGAAIIVSESVMTSVQGRLPGHPRYLGKAKVKGKRQRVGIYEIMPGADDDSERKKIITTKDFEIAVRLYESGDYAAASRAFEQVRQTATDDLASEVYIARCARMSARLSVAQSEKTAELYSVKKRRTDKE